MTNQLINLHIMASVCAQMPDEASRRKFWTESLTLSMESLLRNISRLHDALKSGDLIDLGEVAHKINGTISFVGASGLSERMMKIQDDCDEKRIQLPLADELKIFADLQTVLDELEKSKSTPPL